jgi:hypothetical protein
MRQISKAHQSMPFLDHLEELRWRTFGRCWRQFLRRFCRHAFVGIAITAAFLTPGDSIWGTLAFAAPLYLLYERSVLLATLVSRKAATSGSVAILLAPIALLAHRRAIRMRMA